MRLQKRACILEHCGSVKVQVIQRMEDICLDRKRQSADALLVAFSPPFESGERVDEYQVARARRPKHRDVATPVLCRMQVQVNPLPSG